MITAASQERGTGPERTVLGPSPAQALATTLALVERDLKVLFSGFPSFVLRTSIQPALFAFIFGFVFPRIGQAIGGGASDPGRYASVLLPGLVANMLMFQGIMAVAMPLVTEFAGTREIEDRVMAPVPVGLVAVAKVVSGTLQALLGGLLVIPAIWLASGFAARIELSHPWRLVTILPLGAVVGAALGLTLGTAVPPQRIQLLFTVLLVPLTLLGCVYYPWSSLTPIPWLKYAVLLNPMVYVSEGLRAALWPRVGHMPLPLVYGLLLSVLAVMLILGMRKFHQRVLT